MIRVTNTPASVAHPTPQDNYDYPLILQGTRTGMLAMFFGPKHGMILEGTDPDRDHQKPNYTSTKWKMSQWRPYTGSVTITNGD